ncbi:MAG: nucleotidyltransferase domain-containing protein [bacterium]
MAQVPDKILKIINDFIREAAKDNIPIQQAVLFGSYSKGTYDEWSDIDLAVVSDRFDGNSIYDALKLLDSKRKVSIDLELHPYRPEDFSQDNPFVAEILEQGVRIL